MPLEDDLYKSLIDESKLYREKVSTIWLQKFTMLGAIIAFAAVRSEAATRDPSLIAAAILSLPLIAVLLDVKLAEFGIHANVIDYFVMRHYAHPPILAEWERTKWGVGSNKSDRKRVRFRSIATVSVTVVPTCIIAYLSILAARPYLSPAAYGRLRIAALGFCLAYIGLGVMSGITVLFRRDRSKERSR